MCVFVFRGWGKLTLFYSPQAPVKRVWNPLLPKIDITEQCESQCKKQSIFENPPEPTFGFNIWKEEIRGVIKKFVDCLYKIKTP